MGLAVILALCSPVAGEVTIDWTTVGEPGNPPDDNEWRFTSGFGVVDYTFRISKFKVTRVQYVEFLNAVAKLSDPNGLFTTGADFRFRGSGSMVRDTDSEGHFTYSVRPVWENKPVQVSFLNAMRFVNWLENGQPVGVQGPGTTEDGAYTIVDGFSEKRTPGARYFLASTDEWHKAAFHDPRSASEGGPSGDDHYWQYATRSNSLPTIATANSVGDISNPGPNVVNYNRGADWGGWDGNYTTVGSAGPLSESFWGTSDQSGNLFEWFDKRANFCCRWGRGGNWFSDNHMAANDQLYEAPPDTSRFGAGIRVVLSEAVQDPIKAYAVADTGTDAIFDDMGDIVRTSTSVRIGEYEQGVNNEIDRGVAKFDLPALANPEEISSARFGVFLRDVVGTPAGPVSVYHSIEDNFVQSSPLDYHDTSYLDTNHDLLQPEDVESRYYWADVTDEVKSDYASDANPFSAFRMQIDEASFTEDGESNFFLLDVDAPFPQLLISLAPPTSGLDGDYNEDGIVGAADYPLWRNNRGAPAGTLPNDPTGLPIGLQQYDTWKANYGMTIGSSASAEKVPVPEPAGALLLMLSSVAFYLRWPAPLKLFRSQ